MNRLSHIIILAALFYAAVVLAIFPRWTVDDAYIYYRYAENLAEAGELNWNVGEDPVEGYTGVAMPVVLAAWIKLGGDPLIASKFIGLAGYAFAALMMMLCFARLHVGAIPRTAALGFFLTAPIFFTHAWSGLETTWFAAGVTASLWALLNAVSARPGENAWHGRGRREFMLATLLLMTSLVRPEGVALAFFYGAALLWIRRREGRGAGQSAFWGSLFRFSMFYGLPAVLYFAWRWSYYGHPLPNTFYAKSAQAGFDARSLSNLGRFAFTYLAVPLSLGVFVAFVSGRNRTDGRDHTGRDHTDRREVSRGVATGVVSTGDGVPWGPQSIAFVATALFVGVAWIQYARSVPFMNYAFRFYAPYLPVLLVGVAWLVDGQLNAYFQRQPNRSRVGDGISRDSARGMTGPLALALSALAALQLAMNVYGLSGEFAYANRYKTILENVHAPAAEYIDSLDLGEEWMIVYVDAGIVPYVTGLDTVDFGMLNDEVLAHSDFGAADTESDAKATGKALNDGLNEARAVDYFFARDAGVVVMTSLAEDEIEVRGLGGAIVNDSRFGRYRLVRRFGTRATKIRARDHEFVFLRDDLAERLDLGIRVAEEPNPVGTTES